MSKFKVEEVRTDVLADGEMKSFLFGYKVVEYDEAENEVQQMNQRMLGLQDARELAAALTWMVHLDTWMTAVVEDADVAEEVAAILGLDNDLVSHVAGEDETYEEIETLYDRMTAGALKFLPAGLRRLADRYEREWEEKAASV